MNPKVNINKKKHINQNPKIPKLPKTTDQGNINAISKSNIINKIPTK